MKKYLLFIISKNLIKTTLTSTKCTMDQKVDKKDLFPYFLQSLKFPFLCHFIISLLYLYIRRKTTKNLFYFIRHCIKRNEKKIVQFIFKLNTRSLWDKFHFCRLIIHCFFLIERLRSFFSLFFLEKKYSNIKNCRDSEYFVFKYLLDKY